MLRQDQRHLTNMIEDIDKITVAYNIMSRLMPPFAKLLWPLFLMLPGHNKNMQIF